MIARRTKKPAPPDFVRGIRRPKPERPDEGSNEMEEEPEVETADGEKPEQLDKDVDEGTARLAAFRMAFKDRLKTYGVRYQPGASESGANFNRAQTSEKIADHNDSQRITWITNAPPGTDAYFGHDVSQCSFIWDFGSHFVKVFLLSDTVMQEFEVHWPFRGIRLNIRDRAELTVVLDDIAAIWTAALTNDLEIKRSEFKASPLQNLIIKYAKKKFYRTWAQYSLSQI